MHTKHISGQLAGQVAERDRDPEERLLLLHCSGDSTEASVSSNHQLCPRCLSWSPWAEKDTYESTDDLQSDLKYWRDVLEASRHRWSPAYVVFAWVPVMGICCADGHEKVRNTWRIAFPFISIAGVGSLKYVMPGFLIEWISRRERAETLKRCASISTLTWTHAADWQRLAEVLKRD